MWSDTIFGFVWRILIRVMVFGLKTGLKWSDWLSQPGMITISRSFVLTFLFITGARAFLTPTPSCYFSVWFLENLQRSHTSTCRFIFVHFPYSCPTFSYHCHLYSIIPLALTSKNVLNSSYDGRRGATCRMTWNCKARGRCTPSNQASGLLNKHRSTHSLKDNEKE